MRAYRGRRCIAPLILNFGITQTWVMAVAYLYKWEIKVCHYWKLPNCLPGWLAEYKSDWRNGKDVTVSELRYGPKTSVLQNVPDTLLRWKRREVLLNGFGLCSKETYSCRLAPPSAEKSKVNSSTTASQSNEIGCTARMWKDTDKHLLQQN